MVNGVNKPEITYFFIDRICTFATRKNLINRIKGGPQETRFLLELKEDLKKKEKKKL